MSGCTCEEYEYSEFGRVEGTERLFRVVTDRHFKKNGGLKPSAFPLTDVKERGLSLVRGDLIDRAEFTAITADIVKLSNADEARGAMVGAGASIREKLDTEGNRILCLKDDPVRGEDGVRDNEAHAITMATKPLDMPDVQELRDWMLQNFSNAQPIDQLY